MAEPQNPVKPGYHGYPEAKEGPKTTYVNTPGANPVLRGLPLAVAASAVSNVGFLSSLFWTNAGFSLLRDIKELGDYEARYVPAVLPIDSESEVDASLVNIVSPSYRDQPKLDSRRITAGAFHSAYEAGTLTPTAVAEALLNLIDKSAQHKVAFLSIVRSQVLAAAAGSTQRYKQGKAKSVFDGVPVAVKDEVDLSGHPKSLGSRQDFTHPEDITSWCVTKWEEAGAVIIGKLNMHELGLDTTNNNPVTGTPRNPHNPHYYTGGSSGGSAYAVAAGLLPVTLGVDGGGSIRIPSAYCGIYGLKPSHGRVSRHPTINVAASSSVAGPMASNMADLEYAYRIMATPNPSDSTSSIFSPPWSTTPRPSQRKIIGIYKPWFDAADPPVLNACHAALAAYESAGYQIIDIHLPHLQAGQLAHAMTILAEISNVTSSLNSLTPANKILLSVGKQTPASDFLLAQKMRNLLMQHLAYLFSQHPGLLIVTPTVPNAGWHIGQGDADLARGISDANMSVRNMTYVWLANFTGCPALTIPVGRVKPVEGEGEIPVGMMAMGEWGGEEELLEWGRHGEEWVWSEGGRMGKPANWVDVLGLAGEI